MVGWIVPPVPLPFATGAWRIPTTRVAGEQKSLAVKLCDDEGCNAVKREQSDVRFPSPPTIAGGLSRH